MTKIGIIDSGIGGLSVAKAISDLLPDLDVHYIADHKYLPYGLKTQSFLSERINHLGNYLLKKNCEFIVIACHSASAQLKNIKLDFQWLGVVEPTLSAIIKLDATAKIGVIGTPATINSGIYQTISPNVIAVETPELAELIENNSLEQATIEILFKNKLQNITHLALACTHYPLAQHMFARANLNIIDTPRLCATALAKIYKDSKGQGRYTVESSNSSNIIKTAEKILKRPINQEELSVL